MILYHNLQYFLINLYFYLHQCQAINFIFVWILYFLILKLLLKDIQRISHLPYNLFLIQ